MFLRLTKGRKVLFHQILGWTMSITLHIKPYFVAIKLIGEKKMVNKVMVYLHDLAAGWRHMKHVEIKSGTWKIETWQDL